MSASTMSRAGKKLTANGLSRHGHSPPALEEGFIPSSMRNTHGYVMAFDGDSGSREMGRSQRSPRRWPRSARQPGRRPSPTTIPAIDGVWAPISVDARAGYAIMPVERMENAHRPIIMAVTRLAAEQSVANSVVCVDLETTIRFGNTQITHTTSGKTIAIGDQPW